MTRGTCDAEAAARAAREAAPEVVVTEAAPLVIRRRGRRVTTDAAPGTTEEPARERVQSTENDARLRADVPPHWG